jgi:aerobic-type carbon monoxide dehydrogenase small subunit (CoxS/CutS family)
MTAAEVLESGKEYTDDELHQLLSGHLCRCTGYENIKSIVFSNRIAARILSLIKAGLSIILDRIS